MVYFTLFKLLSYDYKFQRDLNDSQKRSTNLSSEVSKCFWKVVKSTIHEQADSFAAIQQNLELEWFNRYDGQLELDRDAMFSRVKLKLLDSFNKLYTIPKGVWLSKVKEKIEQVVLENFVVDIFIPSCFESNIDKFRNSASYNFSHKIDLKMTNILKDEIPEKCIKECQNIILSEYSKNIKDSLSNGENNYLTTIICSVSEELSKALQMDYSWFDKNINYLVNFWLQENCLIGNLGTNV